MAPICRIQRMPPRFVVLITAVSLSLVVIACGVSNGDGPTSGALTAELVVPPAKQATVAAPTATRTAPTATAIPPSPIAEEGNIDAKQEKPQVSVPNRGYNAMGSDDAPITMFDFSDFL